MRNLVKIIILIVVFSSCENQRKENVRELFYYPNQSEFSEKNNQYLDISSFSNYEELVDSIEILNYHLKNALIKISTDKEDYHILVSTMFSGDHPPNIKFKNILSINNDSIKKYQTYPIKELKEILKRDLLNSGKDNKLSDSSDKLVVSVISDIKDLENLLIKIIRTFREIEKESSDSLSLNIHLNKRMELFQTPPIIKN